MHVSNYREDALFHHHGTSISVLKL